MTAIHVKKKQSFHWFGLPFTMAHFNSLEVINVSLFPLSIIIRVPLIWTKSFEKSVSVKYKLKIDWQTEVKHVHNYGFKEHLSGERRK